VEERYVDRKPRAEDAEGDTLDELALRVLMAAALSEQL
jgi:hypothetical protein